LISSVTVHGVSSELRSGIWLAEQHHNTVPKEVIIAIFGFYPHSAPPHRVLPVLCANGVGARFHSPISCLGCVKVVGVGCRTPNRGAVERLTCTSVLLGSRSTMQHEECGDVVPRPNLTVTSIYQLCVASLVLHIAALTSYTYTSSLVSTYFQTSHCYQNTVRYSDACPDACYCPARHISCGLNYTPCSFDCNGLSRHTLHHIDRRKRSSRHIHMVWTSRLIRARCVLGSRRCRK
jgi:hypothetical protein